MPEDLHSYPPKIVCQLFPKEGAISSFCNLELQGFDKPVSFNMSLQVSERHQELLTEERTQLQVCISIFKDWSRQTQHTIQKLLFNMHGQIPLSPPHTTVLCILFPDIKLKPDLTFFRTVKEYITALTCPVRDSGVLAPPWHLSFTL